VESCTAWYVGGDLATVKKAWELWSERVCLCCYMIEGGELISRKNARLRRYYSFKRKNYLKAR